MRICVILFFLWAGHSAWAKTVYDCKLSGLASGNGVTSAKLTQYFWFTDTLTIVQNGKKHVLKCKYPKDNGYYKMHVRCSKGGKGITLIWDTVGKECSI